MEKLNERSGSNLWPFFFSPERVQHYSFKISKNMKKRKNHHFKKGILDLVLLWISPKPKIPKVPPELQRAIDNCSSLDELTSLLFSMKGMNESCLNAFDKRIEELERAA